MIDWGEEKVDGRKVQVFCAVLAWSRFRFVRFATDQQQATTLGLLAACFDALGGVPKVVLADRAACLKGGVVANVVVPAPDYVRFAAHYRFRPDFCNAADPQSKGIVENLVGYAKDDLLLPLTMDLDAEETPADGGVWLTRWNTRAQAWCAEVNAAEHSEICAVGDQRLVTERELLTPLPSLRLQVGPKPISRQVDKLSCIRFGSARYSVPNALIGSTVTVLVDEQHRRLQVIGAVTGEIRAEHRLVPPGETSIVDDHYGRPRPDRPVRRARPVTPAERDFLALGPVAEAFLTGAAAAGVTKLPGEIDQILQLQAAHGSGPLLAALERAVAFGRWRAGDVRSILATGGHAPHPTPPGQALVMTLPTVPTRPLDAYRLDSSGGEAS